MNLCFCSYRLFDDGPVMSPILESDPVNIAYALGGSYLSYFTLRRLDDQTLARRLAPYDPVIVTLDAVDIRLSHRIIRAAAGRAVGYSEGHVGDYQRLSPADQALFVEAATATRLNLLYWERYVPFYQALSPTPAEYLPYPYLSGFARQRATPPTARQSLVALPTGLAGGTRNGLADLLVARRLQEAGLVETLLVCPEAGGFEPDLAAIRAILTGQSVALRRPALWRQLLAASPLDYRPLLRLRDRWRPAGEATPPLVEVMPGLRALRRTGWPAYLSAIAPARLMIDLNNRETVGRNALDCAALGIPCVSTNRSDLQARLFPATTLNDPWDVDRAVRLCQRLLTEPGFWDEVVGLAGERVADYDLAPFRQRFAGIAARYELGETKN